MRCFILLSVVLFALLTFYINRNKLNGKYRMVRVARPYINATAVFIQSNTEFIKKKLT